MDLDSFSDVFLSLFLKDYYLGIKDFYDFYYGILNYLVSVRLHFDVMYYIDFDKL